MEASKLVCIVGPTRSGKTDLSLLLAEKLQRIELIYADSLAVYKYLDIGTDKPSWECRQRIPHHLVDFLDPKEKWNAFAFRKAAIRSILDIRERKALPIITGGTAFYIYTLWEPHFREGTPADERIRIALSHMRGEQIFALLKRIDPYRAQKIGKKDVQRLVRALEIFMTTGHPPSEKRPQRDSSLFMPLFFGIYWEKETLKRKIAERVELMFQKGIIEEVERLLAMGYTFSIPAFDNFTYSPIVELLQGKISILEAKEKIQKGTFLFAKRQMNWFKKWPIIWFLGEAMPPKTIALKICEFLEKEGVLP